MKIGLQKALGINQDQQQNVHWIQQGEEVVEVKLQGLQQDLQHCTMIISSTDTGIQITFYPIWAEQLKLSI
jgi:hypothetical protein